MKINDSIMTLKGIGEQSAKKLQKLGIYTLEDLMEYYPKDHEDRREIRKINEIIVDEDNAIIAQVASQPQVMKKGKLILVTFRIKDDSGSIFVTFYGQPYMKNQFHIGDIYHFYGKVKRKYQKIEMESPEHKKVTDHQSIKDASSIVPLYSVTKGISQKIMRGFIGRALEEGLPLVEEHLPRSMCQKYDLVDKSYAISHIHFPEDDDAFFKARKRLVFEELFMLQMGLRLIKEDFGQKNKGVPKKLPQRFYELIESLPYDLTSAQKRVVNDIVKDMKSHYAGNRLIQGDVGSGKTVVAAIALFIVAENGMQGALMAPTEVLARQHFEFLEQILVPFGIRISLLTGSTTAKQKREIKESLLSQETQILVGTHALIEEAVEIPRLGLVITDEQHRFGVRQRLKLSTKGQTPDVIVMTATPIPRTLALILYGDMDISIIDELPPGRQPIKTNAVDSSYHPRIYRFITEQIQQGRQCYVICPMVEEQDKQNELKSVMSYASYLQEEIFRDFKVSYLHGKMKAKEKNEVMERFARGESHLLVSTTVIEVGVNVPNATVILIENAERFGLAQLHQLRGRVGRGRHQSYCILVSDAKNKVTRKRLKVMEESTDGFVIADTDLKLRGPGEFFGTRQHGLPEMKIANLYTDAKVLKVAQNAADDLFRHKERLETEEYRLLKQKMTDKFEVEAMHKAL